METLPEIPIGGGRAKQSGEGFSVEVQESAKDLHQTGESGAGVGISQGLGNTVHATALCPVVENCLEQAAAGSELVVDGGARNSRRASYGFQREHGRTLRRSEH